jgi:hypothetical protein
MGIALSKAREEVGDLSPRAPTFFKFPGYGARSAAPPPTPPSFADMVSMSKVISCCRGPPPIKTTSRPPNFTVLGRTPSQQQRDPKAQSSANTGNQPDPPTDAGLLAVVTRALDDFTQKFDQRLKALERGPAAQPSDALVDSVVRKMTEKRKKQADELSRRVKAFKTTNPVTAIVAKLMEGLVDATVNNKPEPLLKMVTDLYNRSTPTKASTPAWDDNLQTLGDLTLGLTDVDDDGQK